MLVPLPSQSCAPASLTPSVRGYSRPGWLLPRALSPLIPVFLLATVYWGLGNNIDVAHVTSIAGVSVRGWGRRTGVRSDKACKKWCVLCKPAGFGLDVHMYMGLTSMLRDLLSAGAVHVDHVSRLRQHGADGERKGGVEGTSLSSCMHCICRPCDTTCVNVLPC